jgi:hypothetical protein
MPQIAFSWPFMARTMIEDRHGVKLPLHVAGKTRPPKKARRRLWKWCDPTPNALRRSRQLTKA